MCVYACMYACICMEYVFTCEDWSWVEGGTFLPRDMHHAHSESETPPRCSCTAGSLAKSNLSAMT